MLKTVQNWLISYGVDAELSSHITALIALFAVLLLGVLVSFVLKRYILRLARFGVKKTKWSEIILRRKTLLRLTKIVPAMVIYSLSPIALVGYDLVAGVVSNLSLIYMIIVLAMVIDSFFNVAEDIYEDLTRTQKIPIKGFIQVLKIVLYFLTCVFVISILLGKTPVYLLSGVGALAAVLMLIFRDSILGFVAGIQLAANKMVSVGDWIEMPKYGADGDVLEVALTTVKVQNWDKTITTIPTYALISESFKNWRGMSESDGRRIKRSINIDMSSIRFCDETMLTRYKKIQYITGYLKGRKQEIDAHNLQEKIDETSLVNGRKMTNIGIFRAYIQAYLANHALVNKNMTLIVRQLPSGMYGLPIELYFFSKDKNWENYEALQADIFDHLLAVITEFDLRVYQHPTGADFRTD